MTGYKICAVGVGIFLIFGCSSSEDTNTQQLKDTVVVDSVLIQDVLENEIIECGCVDEIDENTLIDTSEVLDGRKKR